MLEFSKLKLLSFELGLELVSIVDRNSLEKSLKKESERLENWQSQGFQGEMSYMGRAPEVFSGLNSIMPEAKTVLSFILPYSSTRSSPLKPLHGRVARYAWGKDYHRVIKKKLKKLIQVISDENPTLNARVFTDSVPILERALARRAELGFVGKNTMLIRPGLGSYFFIAEILLDQEIDIKSSSNPLPVFNEDAGCSTCTSCLDNCPTNAFKDEYILDARKCISYLTIEKKKEFTDTEAAYLGEWVFGCDICQEICPFNSAEKDLSIEDSFSEEQGVGEQLNLLEVLKIKTKEDFLNQFQGTALMRAGRVGLTRNSLSVLANTKQFEAIETIIDCSLEDCSLIIRNSAKQALNRLKIDASGVDLNRIKAKLG